MSKTLKKKYNDFRGIYFYGSRARGDSNSYSDYDIVTVFERTIDWKFENEVLNIIYDFIVDNDIIIDCKVYSVNEISNPVTPLRINIKKEGQLYGV
jgi:predicted nucleotidyltransferase